MTHQLNDRGIREAGNLLSDECFGASRAAGWWGQYAEIAPVIQKETICTKLLLVVSEICEGMEGLRKDLQDDKLPHRKMLEVELADAAIRIFDLGGAIAEKMAFNQARADHKPENRAAAGGKTF